MPSSCQEIKWAWAVGGPEFCLPDGVGVPFGSGYTNTLVLQMHYNNEAQTAQTDTSGVDITYISQLRGIDAGVTLIGYPTGSISLEPGKSTVSVTGGCSGLKPRFYSLTLQSSSSY